MMKRSFVRASAIAVSTRHANSSLGTNVSRGAPLSHQIFQKTVQKTDDWLKEVMRECELQDGYQAFAMLRGVLHVLRDRLPFVEAVQLSQQFPLLIRGVYFENYTPTNKPIRVHNKEQFLGMVNQNLGRADVEISLGLPLSLFASGREQITSSRGRNG